MANSYLGKSYAPLDNAVLRHHFQAVATGGYLYQQPPMAEAGSHSTIRTIMVTDPALNGGKPTVIPTIWDGKMLSDREAIRRAIRSKQPWPTGNPNQPWAQSPDADWHGYMRQMGGPPLRENSYISDKYRYDR